jgi:hypothetical protein
MFAFTGLSWGADRIFWFALVNVVVAVLVRNELFLNCLYVVLVSSFRSPRLPVGMKNCVTSGLLYLGGIHAGCGVSSTIWVAVALGDLLEGAEQSTHWAVAPIAGALLAELLAMCVMAVPPVRARAHNLFEYSHRFLGWCSLLTVWVLVLVRIGWPTARIAGGQFFLASASRSPELWLAALASGLVILPWVGVRKVKVCSRVPSPAVVEITFLAGSGVGRFGRISRHVLSDWHSFALVSCGSPSTSHKMLICRAGDFTGELINAPPTRLYVRKVGYPGLPYCMSMYQRVVVIASGAGVAPYVSMLSRQYHGRCRLIWIGRAFRATFGDEFCDRVFEWPDLLLVDTANGGRPDLVSLAVDNYHGFGADAVFIGSNPTGTRQILSGCRARGIPAFGPSWDS